MAIVHNEEVKQMKIKQHAESGLWVTSDGRVIMPPDGRRFKKFRFTYGCKTSNGYMAVTFRGKKYLVHRLLAETFLPNPNGYPTVDHKNRDKTDNRVFENLQWADRKMQNDNRQICEDSKARYGVRYCEDPNAYNRAFYAKNPEYAERQRAKDRARMRDLRANNPEFAERERARSRAYNRERYANDPEFAERRRAYNHERYANDPEFVERCRAKNREWKAKQKALGKRARRCPDGSRRYLTDEEYDARYGKSPTVMARGAIGEKP